MLRAHDVSILLHLLGRDPTSVSATGQVFLREGWENVVFLHLRFEAAAESLASGGAPVELRAQAAR